MFVQLMPIIRNRSLTIIVMDAGEGKLKVNIIPKQLKEDENSALSLPLAPQMIEGTPEEFDRDLPEALKQYVANHLTIAQVVEKSTAEVEQVKKDTEAAVKAAKNEAATKLKKNNAHATTGTNVPASAPVPPPPPSLFDALGAAPAPEPAASTAPAASTETTNAVAESDEDEAEADEDETESEPLLAGAAA
jgi:PRTRC genetic system protein E